ncbi:putative aldo-keto reductase [Cystobasidium minutum MCA 4210]|uniref:putative aldo-keto reductase n=1 Tax=Cystobasidium minutum MCA 4210 TaxID=1397322 RepID=UPI0034CEFC6D|eukprot:jgi/Rhomi1/152001/estExt_Genewise1.C_3_t30384
MSSLTDSISLPVAPGVPETRIPRFGLGVYESEGEDCYNSVLWALEAGYRLIDSAEWYENEEESGRAIRDFMKKSGTPRSEIFYTTKLMKNLGYDHVRKSIKESLRLAGLDYIDLYLIHGPHPNEKMRLESWRAIEDAVAEGVIRAAGVSNLGVRHLEQLYSAGLKVPIAVNQMDLHPFMRRKELVEYCQSKGIHMEAWAPLVRGMRFDHPAIKSLADKHKKSPAQVLIRWGLQKGYIVIPKSIKKQRVQENAQVFDFQLTNEDMASLENLDEHLVTDWDPSEDP